MAANCMSAQVKPKDTITKKKTEFFLFENDTIWQEAIPLGEVQILPRIRHLNSEEHRQYLILRKKTRKVWPYAKLAAERMQAMNERLAQISDVSEKKRYTRIVQRYIEEEFSAELKKMKRSEGRILIKLIHRQTGETTFELIKDFRSGWNAFWYQNTAKMFKLSLKEEFDPLAVKEDFLIEDILQRSFRLNLLEEQAAAIPIDYFAAYDKWMKSSKMQIPSED